jgi:hypothetical protein
MYRKAVVDYFIYFPDMENDNDRSYSRYLDRHLNRKRSECDADIYLICCFARMLGYIRRYDITAESDY